MRATIEWSVGLLPDVAAATCSRTSASSRRGSRSTRSRRSAPAARGTARRIDGARGARRRLARQADRDRRPAGVLAPRDRARVRARPARGARRGGRDARARTPTTTAASCARVAPAAGRRAARRDAVAAARPRAAEPARRGPPPRRTPTASTTPATSRGACSSTGGSPASSPRCGCGCWSCSARSSRSRRAPARVAWFFALWGEMWQRPSDEVVAGLGECVRLFAESGDEDARRWRSPRARRRGCSCPIPNVKTAAPRADRGGRATPRARQHVGRGDHRGLARPARLAARRARRGARPLQPRDRDRRGERRPVHALGRRQPSGAASAACAERSSRPRRPDPHAAGVDPAAPRGGDRLRPRGALRRRRGARRR